MGAGTHDVADRAKPAVRGRAVRMKPMAEDWERAVAVVAHPDDLEYGAAAAVARWTAQGKHVAYVLVSSGEAGIAGQDPAEVGPLREEEERRSAAMVGVSDVLFLGHPDGLIEYGVPLRRDLARALRQLQPDVVITMSFDLTWGEDGPVNHADHRAVGLAVLDACRDAANEWVFPELGLPRAQVKDAYVAVSGQSEPLRGRHRHHRRGHRVASRSTAPTWRASAATSTRTSSSGTWPATSAWPRAASTRSDCSTTRWADRSRQGLRRWCSGRCRP